MISHPERSESCPELVEGDLLFPSSARTNENVSHLHSGFFEFSTQEGRNVESETLISIFVVRL
jgi:hypothetical protein